MQIALLEELLGVLEKSDLLLGCLVFEKKMRQCVSFYMLYVFSCFLSLCVSVFYVLWHAPVLIKDFLSNGPFYHFLILFTLYFDTFSWFFCHYCNDNHQLSLTAVHYHGIFCKLLSQFFASLNMKWNLVENTCFLSCPFFECLNLFISFA